MADWKPKPKSDAKTEDMNLTGEEGFVLSRVDGFMSLKQLVAVTGLPEGRVKQIMQKLVRQGAVDAELASPTAPTSPTSPPMSTAPSARRSASPAARPEPIHTDVDDVSQQALRELHDADVTVEDGRVPSASSPSVPASVALPDAELGVPDERSARDERDASVPEPSRDDDDGGGDDHDDGEPATDVVEPVDVDDKPQSADEEAEEANHRKLYNETLSKLEPPEREALARSAADPHLMALCFDALPAVIKGIFENSRSGMGHARMVARHHHTPQGLDVVMGRAEFFRDLQVQRFLLQNTMLQEAQLKKLLGSKRLADVYKVSISREIPERNRTKARNVLRAKWATAEGEERAGLVFTTEGRCLMMLQGLPMDSQMAMFLTQKTYNSSLLIQNLARFGATPPQVLSHLLKQPACRRQQHLRTMIKQHPNCPSDAKRQA